MHLAVTFLLIFTRLMALMVTAPVLGSRAVGMLPRIGIACGLCILVLPLVGFTANVPTHPAAIGAALLSEVLIGSLLGLGVLIIFAAAQMVGTVIGQMAGLQFTDQVDPGSGSASTSLSQFFGVLSLVVFALMGGPEMLIDAVIGSFATLPLGSTLDSVMVVDLLIQLLQQSFVLTLRGVAPAVAALLIATIVIGMVSKTYPQLNTIGIGLSSNLIVMMLAIFLTLGGCVWLFVDDLEQTIDLIKSTIAIPVSSTEGLEHVGT